MRQSFVSRVRIRAPFRALLVVLGAALVLLGSSPARAQASYFYLDRMEVSGAPDDGFVVWRPHLYDQTRFYGFAALGYAHNPLRDETVTADTETQNLIRDPIRGQILSYFNVGVEITRRLGLNVSLPVMWYKFTNPDPLVVGVGEGGLDGKRTAIHDLRFDARVRIYESDSRKFRFGGGGALWAPTGNAGAFAGDAALSGLLYVSSEYEFTHAGPVISARAQHRRPAGLAVHGLGAPLRRGRVHAVPRKQAAYRRGALGDDRYRGARPQERKLVLRFPEHGHRVARTGALPDWKA